MVRRLHLITGLVLFTYLLTHQLNHALGLISLEAMEAGRRVFLAAWRNPPGTALLYGSLLLHFGLALAAVYRRRRLAMPAWEAAQLGLGLAIPPLLALHILGTRVANAAFGVDDSYTYVLLVYFVSSPILGAKQILVMLVAWLHGCIGLHYWLRLRRWYARALPYLYGSALMLPALALIGFFDGGRNVARLAADPVWLEQALARIHPADAAQVALIYRLDTALIIATAGLLAAILVARWLRLRLARRRGLVTVVYPSGRRVEVAPGTTILEASRGAGIPHASVCGGRGRCSTCRVRIGAGAASLPPPSEAEAAVLQRISAAPNVRLACQTRPTGEVAVTPLLPATATPQHALARTAHRQGEEREVTILFADLRGFTALAEHKLPYDVVFILNRYFAAMGQAVEESGGRIDKFIGDGVMALFGVDGGIEEGARAALAAARAMAERLADLNRALAHDLPAPLRIGIGIHSGAVIVGELGYKAATSLTAVGDAVNTASRLEAMSKDLDVQLVLSAPVAMRSGLDLAAFPRREIELRGRTGRLAVLAVARILDLPVAEDAAA
ncbi:MAG TPA: adenylate/guanylate cyclase domain-containing protein [Kiloniellales bacterium]